jgi:aspartate carbamoyltransferase catalytic subunit
MSGIQLHEIFQISEEQDEQKINDTQILNAMNGLFETCLKNHFPEIKIKHDYSTKRSVMVISSGEQIYQYFLSETVFKQILRQIKISLGLIKQTDENDAEIEICGYHDAEFKWFLGKCLLALDIQIQAENRNIEIQISISEREFNWYKFWLQEESEKGKWFGTEDEKLHSVVFSQQFDLEFLMYIFKLSDAIRRIEDTKPGAVYLKKLLIGKCLMLYFIQPSSRTFESFQRAGQILGMDTIDVQDARVSSEFKGESGLDSGQTHGTYADAFVVRHPDPSYSEKLAWHLLRTKRKRPVINGGSGQEQHPTQAILDAYTMYRHFREINGFFGKRITFVGDLRSRVVRSNVYLLRNFPGIKLRFCAPQEYQIEEDMIDFLKKHSIEYEIRNCFSEAEIVDSDVIYMTRLQNDNDENDPYRRTRIIPGFQLGKKEQPWLKPNAIVMHPLPKRKELCIEAEDDPRIRIWSQVRNGMWIRAALLAIIFGVDKAIKANSDYSCLFSE